MPEVDSVLTTSEVQQLIEQQGVSFADLPCTPMDSLLGSHAGQDQLCYVHGGSGVCCSLAAIALSHSFGCFHTPEKRS